MSYPQDVDKDPPAGGALEFATPWRRLIPFIVGGVGVVLIVIGVGITLWKQQPVESVEAETTQPVNSVKGVNSVKLFKVDVSGAIQKPGVVETPADSRVQDVLIAAGGFDAKADRMYISRNINLAQPVQDGMKIYVPFENEILADSQQTQADRAFNINTSSQAKLEELPGIGPVTAKKIIDNRPYQSINDLVNKKLISKSVFEKIKDQVTFY